ncbi:MAG: alpha/beta fold hydrolase [Mycobacterium sp.]
MQDTSRTAAVSVDERRVDTPHGSIFAREAPGDGPAVVLMHGFPDDQRIYARLLPLLSPQRAVTFDFLGYGRSERSDTAGFTPDDHAEQITAVVDALDIPDAVLVGHDASGPDAVFYTVAHPERVAHLALLNTMFGRGDALTMPEMTKLLSEPELGTLADDMIRDPAQRLWLLQRWGQQWDLDAADPDGLAAQSILPQFYGNDSQPDALAAIRRWTAQLPASLDRQDTLVAEEALHRIDTPVSIIFGERDRYLGPALAAEMAGLFAKSALHLVEQAGHYPQYDRPETVAAFLTQVARDPTRRI